MEFYNIFSQLITGSPIIEKSENKLKGGAGIKTADNDRIINEAERQLRQFGFVF